MKKKIVCLFLSLLLLCVSLAGCISPRVPRNVDEIIIKNAENIFNQSAEIVSIDVIEKNPAKVKFVVKLADGFEFPGKYVVSKGSPLFANSWSRYINYSDIEKKISDNWPEIKALADALKVMLDTPEYVTTGIDPFDWHYQYLHIRIQSKKELDAVAEFIVEANKILDFTWTSSVPGFSVVLRKKGDAVTISTFSFDRYHYLDPWNPDVENPRYEKYDRLSDIEVVMDSLEQGWAYEVERGTITDEGDIIQPHNI